MKLSTRLVRCSQRLREEVDNLRFADPVSLVYNPLAYAWEPYQAYLKRFGNAPKRVLFLGMNPGPFGMTQTGVPFGEVAAVRDWLQIRGKVGSPPREHPKRPVQGFACARSEVSGRRLWGLFADRFDTADAFFAEHFVANYCPLVFLEETGRNRTPDKLPAAETAPLQAACDDHLRSVVELLDPEHLVGIGAWAQKRLQTVFPARKRSIGRVLHPSPASPAANRGWAEAATRELQAQGIW